MALNVTKNRNGGFTLIELLVAIVIMSVSMMAVLTSLLASQRANVDNDLRNTAIRLTNQTAEALLALPLSDAELTSASPPGTYHKRTAGDATQTAKGLPDALQTVRNFQQSYTIEWLVTTLTQSAVQIKITVSYVNRGQNLTNTAVIYKM